MKLKNDPYGIYVDKLNIDWNAFAADTRSKSVETARKRCVRRLWKMATATVAVAIAMGIVVMHKNVTEPIYDFTAFYSVPGELRGYDIPTSFSMLDGYPKMREGAAMVDYITGTN